MRKRKFNFQDFLKSKEIYQFNKLYWKDFIYTINSDFKNWMTEHYVNGVEITDGNPLVSMIYGDKALRIVQTERDDLKPRLASWTKKYEDTEITELIVCIQPFEEIYAETQTLITLFMQNRHMRFKNSINRKYNAILNQRRTKFLIKSYDVISSQNALISPNLELDKNTARRISAIARKLNPYDSDFRNAKLERSYNQSLEKVQLIKQNLHKSKKISRLEARKINSAFKAFKVQIIKLKSEIENNKNFS